ncbi:MAG: AAA family ATPase, partial [Bowdeniella nasicola]|nr:AAA family ATPase [Bowdeniella nasicola]
MIDQLTIRNIGVIEAATLEFCPGLNVITGETGAGKTMLLTAIGLITGERADSSRVRAGAARASVDAVFVGEQATKFAETMDAECDDGEVIVSRTVPASGRARARLGTRPVPAAALAELAATTITIHGQAQQLHLRSTTYQRETLDAAGGEKIAKLQAEYRESYEHYHRLTARLEASRADSQARAQQRQALETGIRMITGVEPRIGEDDELRTRIEQLTNIDEVRRALTSAITILDAEEGVLSQLDQLSHTLTTMARFDPSAASLADEVSDASSQIGEVHNELARKLTDLDADPDQLDALHERRAEITTLLRVYGPTIAEALTWRDQAHAKLQDLDDSPAALARLHEETQRAHQQVSAAAAALHQQ